MKFVIKFRYNGNNFETKTFFLIFLGICLAALSINAYEKETVKSVQGTLDTVNANKIEVETDYVGPRIENGTITLRFMKHLIKFYKQGPRNHILHQKFVFIILTLVRNHFTLQRTLINVKLPAKEKITVCGDIHGNLNDLLHIFDLNGLPSEKNRYIFNGDLVDIGDASLECALICFGFKLLYPNAFFINRGNHEDIKQNHEPGGLADQILERYIGNLKLIDAFSEVFQWLPLAYVIKSDVTEKTGQDGLVGAYAPIHGSVLVVHGGLFSKKNATLKDIGMLKRNRDAIEAGEKSMMFDILWSDPCDKDGRHWNQFRKASIQFGPDVSESFCKRNKIDYIIRSHLAVEEGYKIEHNGRVITVFSATNFSGQSNKGAIAVLRAPELKPRFTTYASSSAGYKDKKDISIRK